MWRFIKGFVKFWVILFLIIFFISCYLYRSEIVEIMKHNLWMVIDGLMPILLVIGGILYAILSALRK